MRTAPFPRSLIQRRAEGIATLFLAIPTPLLPTENHMDQYRYTPIRSRDSDAVAARRPLSVFHVKPWEYQNLSVAALLTSETLLGWERGMVVHHLEPSQ